MAKSKSIFLLTEIFGGGRKNPMIMIPLDPNQKGTVEERTKRATRWLWSHGIYPSPSAVNMRMRGKTRDCLNGIETKVRNEVAKELGIPYQRETTAGDRIRRRL